VKTISIQVPDQLARDILEFGISASALSQQVLHAAVIRAKAEAGAPAPLEGRIVAAVRVTFSCGHLELQVRDEAGAWLELPGTKAMCMICYKGPLGDYDGSGDDPARRIIVNVEAMTLPHPLEGHS
jgi:hypothetical protein